VLKNKDHDHSTTNVTTILIGALFFGLAAGLPVGYFAHQLYAAAPNSDLASLQK
jgi:hypothetical protein